jgi:hypothetical protein
MLSECLEHPDTDGGTPYAIGAMLCVFVAMLCVFLGTRRQFLAMLCAFFGLLHAFAATLCPFLGYW